MLRSWSKWFLIGLGGLIYSVGLNAFLVANHLAEGGFVGISVLLLYKLHWPLGLTFFLLNIPLLIPAWKKFGHDFILRTTVGVVAVSLFSSLTANLQLPTPDHLLGALYAGVVTGLGLGLIFRAGATTGGADIIARFVRHWYGYSMGKTLFAIDVLVIGMVAFIIGREVAMYSLVALFVSSRVIDFVIEGVKAGKAVHIISDKHSEIVEAIHAKLERGTTLLDASGGYTGAEKRVIYCVVAREEVGRIQQIVHDIDPRAFVVVNDVHEVLGEGFTYPSP
ncbi:membrane protein [Alicyclobacillus contaminans]|uniref:YitT family protein n=1 Tax=Alicyclobacillus contaminans TaxID=392016 RepID=UPI0004260911|nr:YitT family protein [Alicyclobacillus contaminans]GMA48705.1 membrane protein [Alicyclobacillus contaminans]